MKESQQPATGDGFEPEITAFSCIYCAYMAGDTAGALHITYPPNVKLVKLPCTGKIDVEYLLEAFEQGADGAYVVACPVGNCHHIHGNERATRRVQYARRLLDEIGIGGERVGMYYMSGGQGGAFAQAATEMTERIRQMGPNPLKKNQVF